MVNTKNLKNFSFGNATDVGLVRQENEDYLGYFETINGHIFIVCDGMGGHIGGAIASRLAVKSIKYYYEEEYYENVFVTLEESIKYANIQLLEENRKNPELIGMGTTIVLVVIRDNKYYYAHVGDSRLYICQNSKLLQLTKDHSFVQTLIDQGLINDKEAAEHPRRNEITKALGLKDVIDVNVFPDACTAIDDNCLLLCTDGLTSMVQDKEIEDVINENISEQHKAIKLLDMSNKNGGFDNTTVQLIKFYNVGNINEPRPQKELEKVDKVSFIASMLKIKAVKYTVIAIVAIFLSFIIFDLFLRKSILPPTHPDNVVDDTLINKSDSGNVVISDTVFFEYILRKNEKVEELARRFQINMELLEKGNDLKNKKIEPGLLVRIPVQKIHYVKEGEGINDVAENYNVSVESIIKANVLKNTNIRLNQHLYIPLLGGE